MKNLLFAAAVVEIVSFVVFESITHEHCPAVGWPLNMAAGLGAIALGVLVVGSIIQFVREEL